MDPTETAGYKAHTRARSTGTLVILCDTEAQGVSLDDGGPYMLICEEHAGSLNLDDSATARWMMRHPEEWCPGCQDVRDAYGHFAGRT